MKNGNLYQRIKSAKKEERIAFAKKCEIIQAMENELEAATRPIKEKYEPILNAIRKENSEKSDKVWSLGRIYHDCGSFPRRIIVNTVAVFLSYIEGEKYIPFSNAEVCQNSIIIKEEVSKNIDNMDYDTLDRLYKNGDLIALDNGFSNVVDFYDNIGEPNYSLGGFNYLHEFVNRLIQYRSDNLKRDNITEEELYSFMCKFISTHPDLAMMNKDKREQMLMGQSSEETVISQCKKLEKKLKYN